MAATCPRHAQRPADRQCRGTPARRRHRSLVMPRDSTSVLGPTSGRWPPSMAPGCRMWTSRQSDPLAQPTRAKQPRNRCRGRPAAAAAGRPRRGRLPPAAHPYPGRCPPLVAGLPAAGVAPAAARAYRHRQRTRGIAGPRDHPPDGRPHARPSRRQSSEVSRIYPVAHRRSIRPDQTVRRSRVAATDARDIGRSPCHGRSWSGLPGTRRGRRSRSRPRCWRRSTDPPVRDPSRPARPARRCCRSLP
jgi:hypothetical protein